MNKSHFEAIDFYASTLGTLLGSLDAILKFEHFDDNQKLIEVRRVFDAAMKASNKFHGKEEPSHDEGT